MASSFQHTQLDVPLWATNPSVASESFVLLRVTPCSHCSRADAPARCFGTRAQRRALFTRNITSNSIIAFVRRGARRPLNFLRGFEDARPFVSRLAAGTVYVLAHVFTWADDIAEWANHIQLLQLSAVDFSRLSPARPLQFAQAHRREKNWVPFAEEPSAVPASPFLLLTYSLEPHVVLRCSTHDASCHVAYNTSAASLLRRRLVDSAVARKLVYHHKIPLEHLRGGSTCSEITSSPPGALSRNARVCVGHWHNSFGLYIHFFYLLEPTPPYAVSAVSHPFRFRRFFDDDRDRVQFATGTTLSADGSLLRIFFGIADCVAAETALPVDDVRMMLSGELVRARL